MVTVSSDPVNATQAFIRLCERAGVKYRIPEDIDQMCCGTPWKSKGYTDGYSIMSDRVLKALWEATDGGHIPDRVRCFFMHRGP